MTPFFYIHISQGSVATCLKCGGIFKHEFVANLLPSRLMKKFGNRIIVSKVMANSLVSCFFWLTVYKWSTIQLYIVSQKTSTFYFWITLSKVNRFLMIFDMWNPEKIWHKNLTHCPPCLSDIATVSWEIEKRSFSTVLFIHTSDYLHYLTENNL